jgi:hypothetical protein
MNTFEFPTAQQNLFSDDDLLHLQKITAQRADELLREQGGSRGNDLELWLRAEGEVLQQTIVTASR